jgi:hypothetical protein
MECKENDADIDDRFPADIEKAANRATLTFINKSKITSVKSVFFTSVKNTFNTVTYKEQFLIKLASTKNVTFNVSCIKKVFLFDTVRI